MRVSKIEFQIKNINRIRNKIFHIPLIKKFEAHLEMKLATIILSLFVLTFKTQGMEVELNENQDITPQTSSYKTIVDELIKETEFYMEALKVNGRDYSELVIGEINEARECAGRAEKEVQQSFQTQEKLIEVAWLNEIDRCVKFQKQTWNPSRPLIKKSSLCEKVQGFYEEEVDSLQHSFSQLTADFGDFYDTSIKVLDTRNNAYVEIYFCLQSLQHPLEKPFDPKNPHSILEHYQGAKSCLDELNEIITFWKENENFNIVFSENILKHTKGINFQEKSYVLKHQISEDTILRGLLEKFSILLIECNEIITDTQTSSNQ